MYYVVGYRGSKIHLLGTDSLRTSFQFARSTLGFSAPDRRPRRRVRGLRPLVAGIAKKTSRAMAAHTQGYCGWREGKQRDLRREGLDIDDKTGLPRSIKVNKGAHQGETFRLNSQLHGIGYGPSIIMLLCWGLAQHVPQYVSPEPPRTNRQSCGIFVNKHRL